MSAAALPQRFWSKVDKTETCWFWTASIRSGGYGNFRSGGQMVLAHKLCYEALVGLVPEGLELDHLCRTPSCVNPAHLEPVTHRENILRGVSAPAQNFRKTHCPQGHPYDDKNTYWFRGQQRQCRACDKDYKQRPEYRRQQVEANRRRRRERQVARRVVVALNGAAGEGAGGDSVLPRAPLSAGVDVREPQAGPLLLLGPSRLPASTEQPSRASLAAVVADAPALTIGSVAQLAEQELFKLTVAGSMPARPIGTDAAVYACSRPRVAPGQGAGAVSDGGLGGVRSDLPAAVLRALATAGFGEAA